METNDYVYLMEAVVRKWLIVNRRCGGSVVRDGKLTVFVDESGNTGDIRIRKSSDLTFAGQPAFVLAGVGVPNDRLDELTRTVGQLRVTHRVLAEELKASKVFSKKPDFITGVLTFLYEGRYPLFLELVDKKYMLCNQIANAMCAFGLRGLSRDSINILRACADMLYDSLPFEVYRCFSAASVERTEASKRDFIEGIDAVLRERQAHGYAYLFTLSLRKHGLLLPEPDPVGQRERLVALPNLSSYTNIAARAEAYRSRQGIPHLRLVHDEQKEFSSVLERNLDWLRHNDISGIIEDPELNLRVHYYVPNAEDAMGKSHELAGLQVADLVAGTVSRIWKGFVESGRVRQPYREILKMVLLGPSDQDPSCGLNCVVPQRQFDALCSALVG